MRFFEYQSKVFDCSGMNSEHTEEDGWVEQNQKWFEKLLNRWGKEGWDVISVIAPDPRYPSTFRVTAKREVLSQRTPTGRKFR